MIGMIVWILPVGERPNSQRGKVEAIAAGHMMLTMCGDGEVICVPLTYLNGIEFDDKVTIHFREVRITK